MKATWSMTVLSPFSLLERRCGSRRAALEEIEKVTYRLGSSGPQEILAAVALAMRGFESSVAISASLSWSEFEEFCARLLLAAGFEVRRGIVLTRPRRQLDIVAKSSSLCLSVDCKHWRGRLAPASLERFASQQAERSRLYKEKLKEALPILPVILTLLDSGAFIVERVPVVPLASLREFAFSVNRFDDRLLFV